MKQRLVLSACALLSLAGSVRSGEIDCPSLQAEAATDAVRIDGCESDRVVTGKGRLQFHSAPDPICAMPGVFVIPDDHVIAYAEYGAYTEVMYIHPKTGNDTMGWVESARLQETGLGIANCEE